MDGANLQVAAGKEELTTDDEFQQDGAISRLKPISNLQAAKALYIPQLLYETECLALY